MQAFSFMTYSYYMPIVFQILGSSATLSGIEFMPFSVGTAVVSVCSGFLVAKFKKTREAMVIAYLLGVIGFGLSATLNSTSNRCVPCA